MGKEYKFTPKEIRQALLDRCDELGKLSSLSAHKDILDLIYKVIEAMP